MAIAIGEEAPDFTLKDQDGNDVTLSSFRGKQNVALVFYPFTFTGICQGELCELRDDLSKYERANVQVLACSCDSRFSQKKWADEQGYTFPVLSDSWPHGKVAQAYGVFNEMVGCREPGDVHHRQGRQDRRRVRVREPRHAARAGVVRRCARQARPDAVGLIRGGASR